LISKYEWICGETFFAKKVSPHPFKKALAKSHPNRFVSLRIDSRRERYARFCCRYFVGTTETLQNRKVVKRENGPPGRSVPTMRHTNSVGTGVLDGPKSRGEEIACNLVAACRLPLGRPFFSCNLNRFMI